MKLLTLLLSFVDCWAFIFKELVVYAVVVGEGLDHCCFDFLIHVVAEVMLGVENKVAHFV